jgi:2,4-dienoyl-CoA reductase-like NADH-dependent reductase (Old Yellow Enzyme family)
VVGNRVITGIGATASDQYIAGLISISQHALNSGQGFINFIDYNKAELRVGGRFGDSATGARVRLNDPVVAEDLLKGGYCDLVGMVRAGIADAEFRQQGA